MANYKGHRNAGVVVGILAAALAYWQFHLDPIEAAAVLVISAVCAILPDLDHPEAKPGSVLKMVVVYMIPITVYMYLPKSVVQKFEITHWIVLFAFSHVILGSIILWLIDMVADHRGLFHSTPAALLCGVACYLSFSYLPFDKRLVFGGAACLGYFTHLIQDEICSLDMKENKIKRSFGTALDFGDFRSAWCWLLYLALFGCVGVAVYLGK